MKILITGGAGYIGYSLVRKLNAVSNVEKIIVYDNLSRDNYNIFWNSLKLTKLSFIKADILDSFSLEKAMNEVDTIIHLAGFVAFPYNHLQNFQYEQINCYGSLNVVRCIQQIKNIKKILYVSSTSVFGFRENILIDEEANPENSYGESKLKGEEYFRLLKNSHQLSIFRLANVFGFNQAVRLDSVINTFIYESIVYGKINIYGNGEQFRCFVKLDRVINKILDWIKSKNYKEIEVVADFNASLNEIKDWLLTKNPQLEYQYINQNQNFPSQSIHINNQNKINLLDETYDEFYSNSAV